MYISWKDRCAVSELIGLTLSTITGLENGSEEVTFKSECGRQFLMFHDQGCCENVRLEDVEGDVQDLTFSPILMAEEVEGVAEAPEYADSYTWTFYRISTAKGWVVLRWLGESNGYYSESVYFTRTHKPVGLEKD